MHDERTQDGDPAVTIARQRLGRLTLHNGAGQDENAIRAEAWGPIVDAIENALSLPLSASDRADLLVAYRAGCRILGRAPFRCVD
jgi:hypothetical protein